MNRLGNILWTVANFFLIGALTRRRARRNALAERRREFERLSRLRGFRRAYLRRQHLLAMNADPVRRHLPRRVRRAAARAAGKAAFRLERELPAIGSRGHRRRVMRVAYDLLRARPVVAARAA